MLRKYGHDGLGKSLVYDEIESSDNEIDPSNIVRSLSVKAPNISTPA